jgi:hypothetical protein
MTWFSIRVGVRTILLFLIFVLGLPTLIFFGLIALPGILLFALPTRLGFESVSLGRLGTLSFGASETEKAELRVKLALIKRDLNRLRHPVRWPS